MCLIPMLCLNFPPNVPGWCGMRFAAYGKTVAGIYNAVLDEALSPAALQGVAEYVGAAGATYTLVNRFTRRVGSRVSWGSFTGNTADYLAHYSKIDPFR